MQKANLTSQIDGETQSFTIPEEYKSGSLRVYWNGVRQVSSITFTEQTSTTFSVTFVPLVGDYITVDYSKP